MQTFLPYAGFHESARALDPQRLGKQRLEARQLQRAIELWRSQGVASPWMNHPAALMWLRHPLALAAYTNVVIEEWVRRGYKNNMVLTELTGQVVEYPLWLGDEAFHASHRAALLAKDPVWYGRHGWSETPRVEYVWPEGSP